MTSPESGENLALGHELLLGIIKRLPDFINAGGCITFNVDEAK